MALLRSFGSRHKQSVPSCLLEYVRDDTHLVGWETEAMTPFGDHVIQGVLYMFLVLYGYLPLGVLDQQNGRVSPHGICVGHVVYCVE